MSFQFIVIQGPDLGRVFTLQPGRDQMLGRGANSLYHLSDLSASRAHCQILLENDRVTIVDNASRSGTRVNGEQVSRHELKLGDVVRVGDTQLRLQMGDFALEDALRVVDQRKIKEPSATNDTHKLHALAGKRLARFDIGPVIGDGSTSVVFQAEDTEQNRSLALRVLLPEFSRNEEEMQRFIRGMKTAMPLRHPNLVTVYGAGKTGPYCWVSMEYVAGENMEQAIARIGRAGCLDWHLAFKVAVHVGRALAYAHERQIIHRNVTPRNILLDATDKTVKLGDLLLAKSLQGMEGKQITRPGELVGDVAYMSPERTRADAEVDARSDVYGLGATVYALLTGRPPFTGTTLIEKITRIRQFDPEPPSKYQPGIPSALETVALKMLAKRPEDRYQSAAVLVQELEKTGKTHGVTV